MKKTSNELCVDDGKSKKIVDKNVTNNNGIMMMSSGNKVMSDKDVTDDDGVITKANETENNMGIICEC